MNSWLIATLSPIMYVVVLGLPIKYHQEESPISKLVIPYAPYTTDLVKDLKGKTQKVYVPLKMDTVQLVSLQKGEFAMGSRKGIALNFADGAYPVYYMPGNANGKFQDKMIYLLE